MNEEASTYDATLSKVIEIVGDTRGCLLDRSRITARHLLRDDLGLDSLAMVDVMVAVEDTFAMQFDPVGTDLEQVFTSVGSLADFLEHNNPG